MPAIGLPGQTGSGSSQWPAGAEAGGGGSVCAAGLLSRCAGARAPPLLLDSALRRRPVSLRARPLFSQAFFSVVARGVHPAGLPPPRLVLWPPRPRPRWLCATETPRSVFGVGVPASPPPDEGEAQGPRSHRVGPFPSPPPNPSAQPCGSGSGASGRYRSGPVACFLLESGRCFVDFCLRIGVPAPAELRASGRA